VPQNKLDVILSHEAKSQAHAAAQWYATHDHQVSDDWIDGIAAAFDILASQAERFPVARENDRFPYILQQMPYGLGKRVTHRILFEIRGDQVIIHQIRHVAQRDMRGDGGGPMTD